MIEITKSFAFDAAHTLVRQIDAEPSRRIHGHSYVAKVALRGEVDPTSGMLMDMGHLERLLHSVRDRLDHRFLDDIEDLGPGTMENLAVWVWSKLQPDCPQLAQVTICRDSAGETCTYWGPDHAT